MDERSHAVWTQVRWRAQRQPAASWVSLENVALATGEVAERSSDLGGSHSTALPRTQTGTRTTATEHSSNHPAAPLLHFPTEQTLCVPTNHLTLHGEGKKTTKITNYTQKIYRE